MVNKGKFAAMTSAGVLALPMVASATSHGGNQLSQLIGEVGGIIQGIIPLIIGLAILFFLWGVFKFFFFKAEDDKTQGRNFMIWGIVGLFVMVSVWGLVRIVQTAVIPTGSDNLPVDAPIAIPNGPSASSGS